MPDFDLNQFRNPPNAHRPFPFWFLNDDLDAAHLDWMLAEFVKDQRYGGVVLHPRTGMEVIYLSDEFFAKWKHVVQRCKELGLFVILYDEYNWPSGVVGGKLLREHPEYRQKFLAFESFPKPRTVHKKMPRPGDVIVKAFGLAPDRVDDLSAHITEKDQFHYAGSVTYEQVLLFYVKIYRGQLFATCCAPGMNGELGYIDLLNPAAVDYFIQETHEQYKRHLGTEFGKTILGMFIDEPSNYEGWQYTDTIFAQFKARYDYDLLDRLYQLVESRGEWRQTRYDYHSLATEFYSASFQRMGEWCAANHLAFTGHLNQEDVLHEVPSNHGDVWGPLSQMHVPGLDFLSDQNGLTGFTKYTSEAPNFAAKMVASIAHAQSREWTLVEVFGGCGWQTTPTELKNTVLWLAASGISGINVHAAFSSLKGLRKRDFPASHFTQEPWWAYYGQFSDLCARLSYFNRTGTHRCHVLYLFPKTEFWMEHVATRISDRYDNFKHAVVRLGDALLRCHVDYDYCFEDQVLAKNLRVEKTGCEFGHEHYSIIILPPATTLPTGVLEFLEDFVRHGGHLVFTGLLPVNSPAAENDPEHAEILRQLLTPEGFRACLSMIIGETRGKTPQILKQPCKTSSSETSVTFLPLVPTASEKSVQAQLRAALSPLLEGLNIAIEGAGADSLVHCRRDSAETEYYLVANLNHKTARATITFPSTGNLQLLDPETGAELAGILFEVTQATPRLQVRHEFRPNAAVIFAIRKGSPPPHQIPQSAPPAVTKRISLPNWQLLFPPAGNLFLLDGPWTIRHLQQGAGSYQSPARSLAPEIDLSKFGFRARFLLGASGFFVKFVKPLLQKSNKLSVTRYTPLATLMKLAQLTERVFGIKLENFGLYSKMELGQAIQKKLGIDLISTALLPGWEYEIEYNLKLDAIPPDLELIYEDLGVPFAAWVNDQALAMPGKPETVWDRANRVIAGISGLLRPGQNVIRVRSQVPNFPDLTPSIHGLEPVALRGSFRVMKNKLVPTPRTPIPGAKDWVKAGFPFLSQGMTYECSVDLAPGPLPPAARLWIEDVRACAGVRVNGVDCGKRAWAPFAFEVVHALRPGRNDFQVTVFNTAQNFFASPIPSGLLSVPVLEYREGPRG